MVRYRVFLLRQNYWQLGQILFALPWPFRIRLNRFLDCAHEQRPLLDPLENHRCHKAEKPYRQGANLHQDLQ